MNKYIDNFNGAIYNEGNLTIVSLQKNRKKAQYTQIRARCGHYPEMFEALTGNFIKLREKQNDLKEAKN